jgi:D-3-phosphoglycerate dehydrogenase
MSETRVIISDQLHPFLAEELAKNNFIVDVQADISNEELLQVIHKYDGLVVNTKIRVNKDLIDRGEKLKFIARAGSGMDHIDVPYALSRNIAVISTPEANANAVAEHALGMLLSLTNHIVRADRELRSGIWRREENRGFELNGRCIGIIGFGNNGSAFASKLAGFDVRILAYDKYLSGFGTDRVEETTLARLQEHADAISFHVPLTPETRYYLNRDFISACAKPFWLINTARGAVVQTSDLLDGLDTGKIRGAALDVFENENFYELPAEDRLLMQRLIASPNTVITPHIAGWTFESWFRISKMLAEKILALQI